MAHYKLPVHIIYDDEAIKTEDLRDVIARLIKSLDNDISTLVDYTPLKVEVILGVIRTGLIKVPPTSVPFPDNSSIILSKFDDFDKSHRIVELRGAFAQVYDDYKMLSSDLRIIFIVNGSSLNGWQDEYEKLYSGFSPVTHVLWVDKNVKKREFADEFKERIIYHHVSEDGNEFTNNLLALLQKEIKNSIRLFQISKTEALHPIKNIPTFLDNAEPVAEPKQKPPPPPPKPAQWEYHEPPKEMGDRKAHKYTQFSNKPCAYGWYMLCASRRGRLHEHEATFREDAVRIDSGNNWHLIAVADGAGSADLSRLGSELVVEAAIKEMRAYVKSQEPSATVAEVACRKALEAAWTALYKTADERQIPFKDLATTLLLLAYHPQLNILGYAQVGDGLIVAQKDDGELVLLGEPESGEYSGQTYFMTSYEHDKLASKSRSLEAKNPLRLFFVMSGGVSDDLYPPLERVMGLVAPMPTVLTSKDPGEALYDLIGYERAGSFDDRTLAVLCNRENVIQKTPPPPLKRK